MVFEPKQTLLKIRTFAQDLENARAQSGMPIVAGKQPHTQLVSPKPEPIPKRPAAAIVETRHSALATPLPVIPFTPTKPPAFHELQKKITPVTIKRTTSDSHVYNKTTYEPSRKTVSVRARKPSPSKANAAGGATVITDSRSSDYRLFPSIIKGITDWINSFKARAKARAIPKYTVTETERRRGVIKKATSKTGSIFTADNDTLREEIRRRKQNPLQTPRDEPGITWSPNTETGYALLPQSPTSSIGKVSVDFKQRATPEPAVTVEFTAPPQSTTYIPEPVFIEPTEPVASADVVVWGADVQPTKANDFEPALQPEATPDSSSKIELNESYELTIPEAHYKVRGLGDITKLNTNTLSLSIVGVVATLIIFVFLVKSLISFITPDKIFTIIPPAAPLTSLTTTTDAPLQAVTEEALTISLEQMDTSSPVEIRLVDESGTPLETDSALSLIGLNRSQNLRSLITNIHLIVYGSERAIVFSVTDATASFGHLLSEESQLIPMIGSVLKTPSDSLCEYEDLALPNVDVRLCSDETASEMLVYGFIDTNTILITRNLSTFTTILGSGQ
jgi:hypothetical protein